MCALLTVILSGSLFTRVVFADDEPKTVSAGDEQPKKLGLHTRRGCIRSFSAPDLGTKTETLEIALGFENNLAD